ncbi:MAG: multifunctional oxoglutarate decarboxylase/oxoglutarate dehydrogenase thiamine pyrophosphate-binding subunit/dihydrolipoyllysine-residue succinyltransferase subunit [Actinobacteria bacterium]|nr:multifunctional oxoglutarate decarboxylase/oxoglutarate dehydrogenase thiamine pyrophosphate-binding subunit/dihydrolipoyllysine-residue succinyltransferase subunit [Actinomycetota bacterium]MCB9413518.1 multifunctional oxoglutarate decarboxylase/oxoglutarate dehydrogenase thiamine pyrophosphate-binding subunit/dihydrolipoyllysine-residue succinyltransferase subunit [Actinomycetota bacterium]
MGPNEWLVDEIYEQYKADRNSVDPAWWDFFADYQPGENGIHSPIGTTAVAPMPQPVAPKPAATPRNPTAGTERTLRGPAARVVANMEQSLTVPTATSVRTVPAKLLVDNRIVINNALSRGRGGKISFTHIIGFALVKALAQMPAMNAAYIEESNGKPGVIIYDQVNLGLAIDLQKPDGTRQLLVPNIKDAQSMDFAQFWSTYEDVVRRARAGDLGVDDFAGTTISLTNPGTLGTQHSVPRLMAGQGAIIGVGAMEYPPEWQGAAPETIARQGISKVLTLTSTYDHRIIQGAQSGDFLRRVHQLLLGADDFYHQIFSALRIPYEPIRWAQDIALSHDSEISKTARVQELIHAYRVRGHLMADVDPLEYKQRGHPDLDVTSHGLTLWDLDREFATGGFGGSAFMRLRDILKVLRDSYCRTLGVEYMHIQDPEQRRWIQDRVEVPLSRPSRDDQLSILRRLNAAEAFETFLQTKYVGQKRFSLEGGESTIAALDAILDAACKANMVEVCIGMPHRGRLNVLANIAGKSYAQIFKEFEGAAHEDSVQGSGDVKYHLGSEGVYQAPDGTSTKVYLAANPSHLEAVDPVLEGIVRAKQDMLDRGSEYPVLPLLMHGDAAFAGQGIVAETLNLSQLRGYRTGGTIHLIVNNQVGFTTSPAHSRSSVYATDAARVIQAPILHVNGDDPEACVRAAELAFEFRQRFNKDVVIDLVCYRRRGHNEADDPSLTNPLMYNLIDQKRSVRKIYTEALIGRGDITLDEAEQALRDFQGQLERVFAETRDDIKHPVDEPEVEPEGPEFPALVDTAISEQTLKHIASGQVTLPEDLTVHNRLRPQLERRMRMIEDGTVDWAMGETLAFGSLLMEGRTVRLAGQDSRRGTFGQRHAVIVDRITGEGYAPLQNLSPDQGRFYVYDSMLSEFAALGFEYGYSVARPEALVLWEAQFGDFANGAQTIMDEFLSSGEQKWQQTSGVVMLLPHGYEGQGPDHSSARIERYLQLCAQDNMTVAMPSTPASFFHLLRWQALSPHQKPLVVFTPKSMLRNKRAVSSAQDFTSGHFQPVIDSGGVDPAKVRKVVLCSGKVTWDLLAAREARGIDDVAILRLERYYPLPGEEIAAALAQYPASAQIMWVQEEPMNQGAFQFLAINLPEFLDGRPMVAASRPASAAPATGSHKAHDLEQAEVVDQALG